MPYIKQLQYFKRVLVSWNGSKFHQIVKVISFNYWRTVSKGINSGLQMFSMSKNHPIYVSKVNVLHKLE